MMQKLDIDKITKQFKSLKIALEKFDDTGDNSIIYRNWQVNRGGYDLIFEIYYKNQWLASVTVGDYYNKYDLETNGISSFDKLGLKLILDDYFHVKKKLENVLTTEELEEFYNEDPRKFKRIFDNDIILKLNL